MNIGKFTKILVAGVTLLLLSSQSIFAGFGVSPTNIYNEYLKPGASFERTVTLSRSDPIEDLDILIEPSLGEIDSWFKFEPGLKFKFPRGASRITFKVIVNVPEGASYRGYEGVIRVKAMKSGQEVQGVSIVKGARLDVDLVTTELNISELNIKSLKMLDSVDGEPLKLEIEAENVGNVEISPSAKIVIKNLQMEDLEEHDASGFGSVKANETKTLTAMFNSALPEGEYFVEASVLVNKDVIRKERLVFRINGEVAQTDNDGKNENRFLASATSFITDHGKTVLYIALLSIVIYLILTYLWKSGRLEKIKNPNLQIALGKEVLPRIVVSILVGSLIFWLITLTQGAISQAKAEKKEKERIAKELEERQKNVIPLEVRVVTGDSDVKGAQTNTELDVNGNPLVVGQKDQEGKAKYPIFAETNTDAKVLYYVSEDQELKVIDEKANWYRVVVEDQNIIGWLEKVNVKSAQ